MIFEDPSGNRWRITLAVFAAVVMLAVGLAGLFIGGLLYHPALPELPSDEFHPLTPVPLDKKPVVSAATSTDLGLRIDLPSSAFVTSTPDIRRLAKGPFITAGFLFQENAESVNSFKSNSENIDLVLPDWYSVLEEKCLVRENIKDDVTPLLKGAGVKIVPRVTNILDGTPHGAEIRKILSRRDTSSCLAEFLAAKAKTDGVEGLHVDFQGLDEPDAFIYDRFMDELGGLLHEERLVLTVTLPLGIHPANLRRTARTADAIIQSFDIPMRGGGAASMSLATYEKNFDSVSRYFSPEKIIVIFDVKAEDSKLGANQSDKYWNFKDIMALAAGVGALPALDPVSGNMEFRYLDEERREHSVKFMNSVSVWNRWIFARRHPVRGFGVLRLGSEDPSIWSFLNKPEAPAWNAAAVPALDDVSAFGSGEIYRIGAVPQAGSINVNLDERGFISAAKYFVLPTGYILERAGPALPDKKLVLTFSGGPDPNWTRQILEILERHQAPAVFFVVGRDARKYPGLMKEIANKGHLAGNHTYSHTDLGQLSDQRIMLEMNSTQRVIESTYGRKTVLFRLPFEPQGQPWTEERLAMLKELNDLGYLLVGGSIDSQDWQRPGLETVIENVIKGAEKGEGHLVLFSGSGEDPTATLAALDRLIPELRGEGYEFIGLAEALKVSNDVLNPPLQNAESILGRIPEAMLLVRGKIWQTIAWLFIATLALSILRIAVLGALTVVSAFRHRRRFTGDVSSMFASIIIPAYNEEKTLIKTVRSIQKSRHKNYEILVVDDGSLDRTVQVAHSLAAEDCRIRLISKPNGGKSSALNAGFAAAKSDIVITIDADTVLYPSTISELIKPFKSDEVDAVCGNVEVGNVCNAVTGFQALEYVTTQNFDRRAFDELNCISVVPGATGAWRRSKVLALGGYESDTLTEDADITLRLLKSGGRIVYVPTARSRTEAPETLRALAKQRFRWSYGTFQCMWKHTGAFFKGPLGWVALPNMFLFQIVFPLLSPIGDAVFLLMVLRGDPEPILVGYLLFLAMDLAGSILAFTLDHRPKKLILFAFIQRFFYRQFMYYITFKALLAILRGRRYGWNKLKRLGTVNQTT